jgi:hypothetical protein
MIERRALERIPINRAALLSFDGISGNHPCVVRNISPFGACISAPYYIFAQDFGLSFNGYDRIFICRVVWRKGTLCGVLFVRCPGSSKSADDSGASAKAVRFGRRTVWRQAGSGLARAEAGVTRGRGD